MKRILTCLLVVAFVFVSAVPAFAMARWNKPGTYRGCMDKQVCYKENPGLSNLYGFMQCSCREAKRCKEEFGHLPDYKPALHQQWVNVCPAYGIDLE